MRNFLLKTKNPSLRSSSARSGFLRILAGLLLAILIVFVFHGAIGKVFTGPVVLLLSLRSYFETSTATFPVFVRDRLTLQTEIDSLTTELAARSGDGAITARLMEENKELRSLLGVTESERIGAGVIARPPLTPYDTLVLDQGSDAGVREGAVVYHVNNEAIGFVGTVFDTYAIVTLFSSPGVETSVYVYGPNVYARAYGEGGGVIRVSLPQGLQVVEGDVVVLPSLKEGLLGTVVRVESVPTQPEQFAYVTRSVPLQSLRGVTISSAPVTEEVSFDDISLHVDMMRPYLTFPIPESASSSTSTPTTMPEGYSE
jgi:cell shape-determining protein MreC